MTTQAQQWDVLLGRNPEGEVVLVALQLPEHKAEIVLNAEEAATLAWELAEASMAMDDGYAWRRATAYEDE